MFSHVDAFGNAPAQSLIDRITRPIPHRRAAPRTFTDYKITTDIDDLPDGITFEALHG